MPLISLVAGQNTVISSAHTYQLQLAISRWSWGVIVGKKDAPLMLLDAESGVSIADDKLLLNLHDIDANIQRLTVYIVKEVGAKNENLTAQLSDLLGDQHYAHIDISAQIADQTALNVLEIYKHKDSWKVRCVLQGYAAGVEKLFSSFGLAATHKSNNARVNIEKSASSSNSVQEISHRVDNSTHVISDANIQLRWQSGDSGKKTISNYFLGDKFKPISDLRMGCFYQLKNAQNGIVYSFDPEFKGSFEGVPYITAGRSNNEHLERLDINTRYQHKLNRYLIFVTMIEAYENWEGLKVDVRFEIPGIDPMVISAKSLMVKPVYAVAMLDFSEQLPKITPLNEYFNDLMELDNAFGWGLPFRSSDNDEDRCENNRDDED